MVSLTGQCFASVVFKSALLVVSEHIKPTEPLVYHCATMHNISASTNIVQFYSIFAKVPGLRRIVIDPIGLCLAKRARRKYTTGRL